MKKKLLSFLLLVFLTNTIFSQQKIKVPHRSLLEAKNATELREIYTQNKLAELTYAKEVLGLSLLPKVLNNGTIVQLIGVSENGTPIYVRTDNTGAAATIGTNKVNPGGSLGLNLTGSGMTNRLGIWDGGSVRTSHQEFGGRAVQTDGASDLSDHATHVAGTMVAGGFQPNAKGMAFQAPIKCYDWNNDETEMQTAANAGMLVSNHSYGNVCGWDYDNTQWIWHGNVDLSSTEDNKFGLYNDAAVLWDQIVFDNPFYLPFKSAGNDRGDYPSNNLPRVYWDNSTGTYKNFTGSIPPADGSFDCISTNGVAKNIMTIGAVEKIAGGWNGANSVVMSSFSGWGPTDDGRIKPDIVAAGVNLTSSYSASNSEYGTISGTSMSSPNASGSAILIQQHYNNLMGKFMRASTLKGLIIQTADEAGTSTGPDYSFGWGLMNTAKAVQTISDSNANNIIESQMAANLTPFNKTIVSDGTKPLRITLCWTDVPGTASNWDKLDDAALKLVNDLDVRLIRVSDNQTFLPYILNPANPNLPATTGDNVRDNVEQIYLAAPTAGGYTVRVTSKKALFNNLSQSFSLIISGISPKPAANFFASAQNSCVGTNITFTNNSSSSNSYIWYFPGGTPSTSTSTNPVVSYSKSGVYAVALKAVGISGTDSIYKKDFIKIGGVSLPFNETFETSSITSSLWTSNNVNNDTFGFKKSTQTSGTSPGNSVMAINIYDNLTLNRRYQLISPILDLKGMQNANLSFQHAYTRYDLSSKDSLIVSISSNCGSSWTRLASLTESRETNDNKMATFTGAGEDAQTSTVRFIPKNSSEWCSSNINSTPCNNLNLASYLGQSNVVLRFEVFASGGNNLFLDNINVAGTPFKPIAGFSIPSLVCNNQKTKFTDTSLNNPTSWNWTVSGPANFNSTERNPEFNFTQTGTYTIKLKVSNQTGTDSVTMMNAFEVKASPASPTITNTGKLTLCNNDSAVLITSGTNLQWYKDSSAISAANGTSYTNKEAGKIAVRTTAANGCSAQSEILEFKVGTSPAVPTVTSSLTANQFCEGGSFTLTSSASSANQWMRNNVDLSGQTNVTLNFNDSGTFSVKVSNGVCSSVSVPLLISKLPRPNTSEIKASRFAYKNDTATYQVTGLAGSTFTWSVTNGAIQSGQTTSKILVKWNNGTSGNVQVTEKGANGCIGAAKSYAVGIWNVGVENIQKADEFTLYPNPANDIITLKNLSNSSKNIVVQVYDLLGKNVLNFNVNPGAKNEQSIDISALTKGVYVFKIISNETITVKTITKN